MTRAAEFCYIAERPDGALLMAVDRISRNAVWTANPELALRITFDGRAAIAQIFGAPLGFRKILVGEAWRGHRATS